MKRNNGEQVTTKSLKNRFTLLRKRILRKTLFLNKHREFMDPRRLHRWEASVSRDLKELDLVNGWIKRAEHNGGFIIWYDRRSKA